MEACKDANDHAAGPDGCGASSAGPEGLSKRFDFYSVLNPRRYDWFREAFISLLVGVTSTSVGTRRNMNTSELWKLMLVVLVTGY